MSAMNIVYRYFDQSQMYINITNRCTNKCKFCIRYTPTGVEGEDLWLIREPEIDEIKEELIKEHFEEAKEIVFCGYGEPTLRYDAIVEVSKMIKEKNPGAIIRINTNGHGNRAAGKDITPLFKGLIDEISISLNAKNAKEYNDICVCDYGEEGFDEMLDFASKAKQHVNSVILSVVDVLPGEDIEECRKIAEGVGVEFRVRHYIE